MLSAVLGLWTLLSQGPSEIKDDEVVIFFPGVGRPVSEADGADWVLEIRGWIFEPEADSVVRAALLGVLRRSLGLEREEDETVQFKERMRWFLVDNERGKEVAIRLGERKYTLDPSGPNGHFSGSVRLSAAEVNALSGSKDCTDGRLRFRAVTREGDARTFAGEIHLIAGAGLSLISDIDDTIKVSEVTSRRALLANTFLRDYEAVPGMAEVYRRLQSRGVSFHYVSASPWQLYEPLSRFLVERGFPAGTYHLKDFRPKDASFFNLFASPEEYKLSVILTILEAFPKRRWILVGDSTERDPEVYGEIARRRPKDIERIFIRDVGGSASTGSRLDAAFSGLPREKWIVFREAAEILPKLPEKRGL